MFLRIAFHKEFFTSARRSWDMSQTATAFHRISPPFFIQAWLQQYSRCSFFHSAYGSFSNAIRPRIDKVLKFDDSMIDVHRVCQIPVDCQCKWLSVFSDGSRNFLKLFSVFWEVLVFSRLVHDCASVIVFEIHSPSLRTLWSAVIKSPNFSARGYCFAKSSSARSPCHLGSQAYFAISVFREVEYEHCDSRVPLFVGTFRTWVMRNVCGCTHFCIFEIISELL